MFVVRPGQPGEHPDLGRPGHAATSRCDAEPVHLRRRALEPDGRLRQPGLTEGKSEEEGAGSSSADLLENARSRTRAPATRWGRSSAARATCCSPTRTRRSRAQNAGEDIDYVVPDNTILIETPIAVTTEADDAAQAFLDYLYTDEAQQLWADSGYRPVDESVLDENEDEFPTPPDLFTIDDLGGWEKVDDRVLRSGERFGRRDRAATWGSRRSESRGRRNCQGTPEAEPQARPRRPRAHPRPGRRRT